MIEGHKTVFNGFKYQCTGGKPLKITELTVAYDAVSSTAILLIIEGPFSGFSTVFQ
jgi:hypothetical protein